MATPISSGIGSTPENTGQPACGISSGPTPPTASEELREGKLGELLRIIFAIDTRSLAAFRVGLSLLILADLYIRSWSISAFLTDDGVLPRSDVISANNGDPWIVSLHMACGSYWFQFFLFAVAAVFGMMLLIGWRTRTAAVMSWLLLMSLHGRNPQVLQGGDVLLRCLAFWSMFLPLGASWSVDRARAPSSERIPRSVTSMAGVALLLQMCFMYWFASSLKSHPDWRTDSTAVFYALSIDQLATPFGHWLLQYRSLLKTLTQATIWQESIGPLLIIVPPLVCAFFSTTLARIAGEWGRLVAIVAFVGFHLGLAATMNLGPFPFVCWVGWIPFLPRMFWNRLEVFWANRHAGLTIWYDGDCGFCAQMVRLVRTFSLIPKSSVVRAVQEDPELHKTMQKYNSWIVVTPDGRQWVAFDALLQVLGFSPWLWPCAYIGNFSPIRWIGNCSYRWIAGHRNLMTNIFSFMKEQPTGAVPRNSIQIVLDLIAVLLLYYVLLWNIRTLHAGKSYYIFDWKVNPGSSQSSFADWASRWFPSNENWIVEIPRLDQYWSMFSPLPLRDDGWYLVPATLQDGSSLDLLTGKSPTESAPTQISSMYGDERWRKYLMNLYSSEFASYRKNYARWLFDHWNRIHAEEKGRQITSLEVIFWKKTNRYDGEPSMSRETLAHWP